MAKLKSWPNPMVILDLEQRIADTKVDRRQVAIFIKNVIISKNPKDCWNWRGRRTSGGYASHLQKHRGKFKNFMAHRVSYMLHFGKIPEKMLIMHLCDNRICTNPFHLKAGTQGDNMRDMAKKQRYLLK